MELLPELGSIIELQKRYKAAKARKSGWSELLRECYEYALPQRETFNRTSPGQDRQREIYDSTAQVAVARFVSRIQMQLCPPWREWSKLTPGLDVPKEVRESPDLLAQLEEQTDVLFSHINHSNFITQAPEAFGDLAVGTGALHISESTSPGGSLLDFQAVPLSELVLEEGPRGTIETVWREHEVPARNIVRMYPGAVLSDELQRAVSEAPDKRVRLVEGTVYAPEADRYQAIVFQAEKGKDLMWQEVYEVSPWVVFRWSVTAGEIYGRGPVMSILPDIKTVNVVKEFTLRNAALNVSGVYTATDDGVINPYTMTIAPNSVIPVGSNDSSNPTLRALERSGDPNLAQIIIEDLQSNIKRALFNSMRQADGPVKSATEIAIDNTELVQDIGASFGRLQTEFAERMLRRCMDILSRAGKLAHIRADGRQITLKHTSPLARAQDQADLLGIQQWLEFMGAINPEVMMLGVKVEDVPEKTGRMIGVDPALLRDESERTKMQEQIAQLVAARQAPE